MRTEYAITAATGPAMAGASVRYRLLRWPFAAAVALELIVGLLLLAAGAPTWGGLVLAVAVVLPLSLVLQAPQLGRAMQHRGFRPGTTMTVEWEPGTFTISTPAGSATHRYDQVVAARILGAAVVLRLRGARLLLVLPAALVPAEARPRLRLRPRP